MQQFATWAATGGITALIALLTLKVTRLGQRDTNVLQAKANDLSTLKENFEEQKAISAGWKDYADILQERLDERKAAFAEERIEWRKERTELIQERNMLARMLRQEIVEISQQFEDPELPPGTAGT